MNLKNKITLITGGTSGIGRATAVAFAEAGAKVVIAGRRESEGAETVKLAEDVGGEAFFVKTDVVREADLQNLVTKTVERFGRLDIAFNNAGVELTGPVTEASEEDYRRLFDINVWGVIASMKYEIPAMLQSGGGSIINTSSGVGHVGMPGVSIYTATKHAVEGLTKSVALEVAKQGIRVNAVSPAVIETEMVDRFAGPQGTEMRDGLAAMHPIGRTGHPIEVAKAVLFLASDDASFITGTSLMVDGGFTAG